MRSFTERCSRDLWFSSKTSVPLKQFSSLKRRWCAEAWDYFGIKYVLSKPGNHSGHFLHTASYAKAQVAKTALTCFGVK